jgi:regulator of sigma E protease
MTWITSFFSALPYFVVLIGLLIFVHEAGHFLFAKLFKVKVHAFSLGFGPKLVGFTRGETEYKVALVPVGGYVKMLGEDPSEEIPAEDRGRAFGDKPLYQRFLIIIGGPAMNIVFPLFLHFGVGLTFTEIVPAELGVVLPGTPAAEAGLEIGDVVEEIDGVAVHAFDDIARLVTPRPGERLEFVVRRGEERITRTIVPDAVEVPVILEEKETVGRIGVGRGYLPPLIGVGDPASVAGRAGLESFDLIEAVSGAGVARLVDLEARLIAAAGSRVELRVRRLAPEAEPPFVPFEEQFGAPEAVGLDVPAGARSLADLGIESSADFVAHVTPGGAAEKIGLRRGDKLASLSGEVLPLGQLFFALDREPDATHTLAWTRAGQRFESPFKASFIPAGEAGDLGIKRDTYDKGFWGLAGRLVDPPAISNPALLAGALRHSVSETWGGLELIGLGFKLLFQGKVSAFLIK